MLSKSKTKKISPTLLSSLTDQIPDNLESLKRLQLQNLAKKFGISANGKSETIKQNLRKLKKNVKLSKTTRLDTQLPRDMQDLIFEKVYNMANPEIETKIKWILDKKSYSGDDYIVYNYSKIRKKLGIKHNFKLKDLQDKVDHFRHKYVRLGVIYYYFQIEEIIEYFDFIDGENEYAREEEDFDSYVRKLRPAEANLRTAIKNYNIAAKKLKEFGSYIKVEFINKINKFINNFRKIAKHTKKIGKIPYLKYGTQLKNNSLSVTKKSRSTKSDIVSRLKSYTKKKSRLTRSI